MQPAVTNAFMAFTAGFEGGSSTNCMYLDSEGLVTTAFGILLPSAAAAAALPWLTSDGTTASTAAVTDEYNHVLSRQDLASASFPARKAITTLHLSTQAMQQAVAAKMTSNETVLKTFFTTWDSMCADAQMLIMSMAWACGPAFPTGGPHPFPNFSNYIKNGNYRAAAYECHIEDNKNPGVAPRNKANFVLCNNAAAVQEQKLNAATLYYPNDLLGIDYPYSDTDWIPSLNGVTGTIGKYLSSTSTAIKTAVGIAGFGGFVALTYWGLTHYFTRK